MKHNAEVGLFTRPSKNGRDFKPHIQRHKTCRYLNPLEMAEEPLCSYQPVSTNK